MRKFRGLWPVLCFCMISLTVLTSRVNAACGGCNQGSQSAQNDGVIQEQERQIRDLERQLKITANEVRITQLLAAVAQKDVTELQAVRGTAKKSSVETFAVADRDERIVSIGRADTPARIQPIQLLVPAAPRDPSTSVRAPGVRVQTGISPRPRASTRSQWNR